MNNLRIFPMLGAVSAFMASAAFLLPIGMPVVAAQEEVEVLTRGPVHEAFAETVTLDPEPGIIVQAAPPEAIEELPPKHQLEGDNVTWIPGYWAWDDERNDFIWISGIWRNVPPEREWVPGYWNELGDSRFQWTSGYWAPIEAEEVAYVSTPPPRSLETGANTPAPSASHTWVPGTWVWSDTRYRWRPGYWIEYRPHWTWVPARYYWTRHGYVYVDGYWDYAVPRRGVLFAPVFYHRPVYTTSDYYFTPSIVVALSVFVDHLFVRPRYHHYYFGDYYAPRYLDSGFYASYSWYSSRGGYDPIFAYQRWDHRDDRDWFDRRRENYEYFRDNEDARPPRTWAAMRELREESTEEGRDRRIAASLDTVVEKPAEGQKFRALDEDRRQKFVAQAKETRKFQEERRKIESKAMPTEGEAVDKAPVREKLDRSPIMGRRANQFAKDEAPPKRPTAPEVDVNVEQQTQREGEKKPARQADREQMQQRQRKADEAQRKAEPQRQREADEPQRKTEPQRQRKADEPQRKVEPQRQRKADEPQRKAEPQRQRRAEEPQRKTEPQRKAEPQQQRKAEEPRRKAEPQQQRKAEEPQRKAEPQRQRNAAEAQRRVEQPKRQTELQRKSEELKRKSDEDEEKKRK